MSGVERIAAERQRQIDEEGYTPAHDQHHSNGALAYAAAVYAAPDPIYHLEVSESATDVLSGTMRWHEPWPRNWRRYRPGLGDVQGRIRELEKAGALIAAEIDRLEALDD